MSDDSILVALEGMQREIAEMKATLSAMVDKFTQVVGHEIRLARVEVDIKAIEGRVIDIERTCIGRQKYVDYLERQPAVETPQSWWDAKVSRVFERLLWIALATAVPTIMKLKGWIK